MTTTTATPRGFGYRHPRMRLAGLLAAPMAWLVVVYLGSLFALFITAFWTVDDFTGQLVRDVHAGELPARLHELGVPTS